MQQSQSTCFLVQYKTAGFLLCFNPTTHIVNASSRMQSTGRLTNNVLYSEVLFSQKTRPEALLSFKFPHPKLPVKTLFRGEEQGEKRGQT